MATNVVAPTPTTPAPVRRRRRPFRIVALVVLLIGFVGGGWWLATRRSVASAASVTCSVWWRPTPSAPPQSAGTVAVDMTEVTTEGVTHDRSVDAGRMRFAARYSNAQPFYGPSLSLDVTDSKGRTVAHTLYQGEREKTNRLAENTGGFTGLDYVDDPDTGAEVQYSCTAE